MDPLSFPLPEARDLFASQTRQLLDAVHSLSELDLLTPSLCVGWSRLELVEHLRIGLDEMAAAACTTTDTAPDHDAASYWGSFARTEDEDPVPGIMWLRRTASASARPAGAVERLAEAAERALAAVASQRDHPVPFQGKVLSAGDFVASWVVELAIHQWDLDLGTHPAPVGSVWARRTLEDLAGCPLPASMPDDLAVLAGMGRRPWPDGIERPAPFPVAV